MKKLSMIAFGIAGALALSAPAQAKSKDHYYDGRDFYDSKAAAREIDRRQAKQAKRINRGVKNGELTKHEVKKLRKQQRRIARLEAEFCYDDYLSGKEARRLNRMLDKAGDKIYALKHNHQTRHYSRSDSGHDRHGRYERVFANSDFNRRDVGVILSW